MAKLPLMPRLLLSGSSWRGGPAGRAMARLSNKLFPFLLTVDAAPHQLSAVLEYQPALAPWLCCFRPQWVIFNPSIQSVSRNRRRNIRHMLTSAPRRCGGVYPSSCWGNPCPSVLTTSERCAQSAWASPHKQVVSTDWAGLGQQSPFLPSAAQKGHGQWHVQCKGTGGGTPSSPGSPSVRPAPQQC